MYGATWLCFLCCLFDQLALLKEVSHGKVEALGYKISSISLPRFSAGCLTTFAFVPLYHEKLVLMQGPVLG